MPYLGKTPSQATRKRYYKTASAGDTSVSGTMTVGGTLTFTDGEFVDVSVNGVALVAGTDYNTTTANTISGLSALSANDQVEIVVYDTFSVFSGDVDSNMSVGGNLSVTGTATLTGNADFNGDLDVDGTTNLDVVDIDGAVDMASTLQVDGAITSSAGATITTADNTTQLTLKSTDADANVGPVLDLVRDSGSPADSDNTGAIVFKADDDGGNSTEFAKIETSIIDASNTTEDGRLLMRTMTAGTATSRLDFTNAETVFNDSSIDVNFRVESDGNANMFFVDAGNDKVGVGTNTPAARFSALSTSGTTTDIGRFEAAVGSFTGTSLVAGNTLGAASSYNLFSCITDSDADAGGPVTQFIVRGDGNVGIGTSSPTQPLSISTSGSNGLFLLRDEGTTTNSCRLYFDSTNTRYAIFANDGTLSFCSGGTPGSSTGTERVAFTVNGINSSGVAGNTTVSSANLFISGGNNFQKSTSSRRYKTNIADATHGLSDVLNLRSVTYKGVNDGETVFGGLIAEEVHDAGLTEFVNYSQDDDGNDIPEGVHYGHMVALAFKAIQELKTELDAEKVKTAALTTRIETLEAGE